MEIGTDGIAGSGLYVSALLCERLGAEAAKPDADTEAAIRMGDARSWPTKATIPAMITTNQTAPAPNARANVLGSPIDSRLPAVLATGPAVVRREAGPPDRDEPGSVRLGTESGTRSFGAVVIGVPLRSW